MTDRVRQAADGQRARVGGVWTREKLVYLTKYAALTRRIPPSDRPRVSLQKADCHERVRDVIHQVSGKTLALAFVDPEGFEVRFELFQTLAQRAIDIIFLFPSGIGISRNLRAFVKREHSPMDGLWGSREWRKTRIARLLAACSAVPAIDEQIDQSWVRAFCERVATLGYSTLTLSAL